MMAELLSSFFLFQNRHVYLRRRLHAAIDAEEFIITHQWINPAGIYRYYCCRGNDTRAGRHQCRYLRRLQSGGVIGSVAATMGLVTPLAADNLTHRPPLLNNLRPLRGQSSYLRIRPAVIALILSAFFVLGQTVLVEMKAVLIALAAFLLLVSGRLDPVAVILVAAVLGVFLY